MDSDWIWYFRSEEIAKEEIRRVLQSRREKADAKVFKSRVVWPRH